MGSIRQRIRFCEAPDGVRIAYSLIGRGPPLVMLSGGHCHLELDLESPVLGHWFSELSRRHSLVRLDTRGFGLSDRGVVDHSLDAVVSDVHAVVDALGLDRIAMLAWLGGTPFALTYANRFPGRVSHLVLHAAYLRGWLKREVGAGERTAVDALVDQVESGWDMKDPIVRRAITSSFIPDGTPAQQAWFDEALRASAFGADAARRLRTRLNSDVRDLATRIGCPTIVLNSEGDTNPVLQGAVVARLGLRRAERARAWRGGADLGGAGQRADRRAIGDQREDRAQSHHAHLREVECRDSRPGDRAGAQRGAAFHRRLTRLWGARPTAVPFPGVRRPLLGPVSH